MKTPEYATVIELALEQRSRAALLFAGNVLEPYDNFFTTDQQFLFREAISCIQSLIVQQLNGETIGSVNLNITRNNSSVILHAPSHNEMVVAFKFPYPTRNRFGSTRMFNYFLFQERGGEALETDTNYSHQNILNSSMYGEFSTGVTTANSGLLQKLHSVISLFNRLNHLREATVEKQDEYFVVKGKSHMTFRYSPEDLFRPPVLQKGKIKARFMQNSLWSMSHSTTSNVLYAFISFFMACIIQLTPLVDGLWNFLIMVVVLFVSTKSFTGLGMSLMSPKHREQFKKDIQRLNATEEIIEAGIDIEDKYGRISEPALSQIGFIERLAQVRVELRNQESYGRFTQLAKSLIQESEYNKELFERLTPLFHLYLPAIQESLTQFSVASESDEQLLLSEMNDTLNTVNEWLLNIQNESKISVLNDLQKVRQHIGNQEQPVIPSLSLSK